MAYRAASACQKSYDWGDTGTTTRTDAPAAQAQLRDLIDGWVYKLEADAVTICLSDDFENYRKDVDPTYKEARATVDRPLELYALKDWLAENYPFARHRRLEADDVMGIMATEPSDEERIIVSQDKDMKTIPGLLYRPFDDEPELLSISLAEADRFHLWQTLVGDAVDGYPGCPGVGPVAADAALDTLEGWGSYEHVFKAGPRKGLSEIRWSKVQLDNAWDVVVTHFVKAGLTPAAALVQARLARILRHGEHENWRPILWSPGA